MSRQSIHRRTLQILFWFFITALIALPSPARAWEGSHVPPLDEFIEQVTNDEADVLRGIYVTDEFAFSIIPQPADNPAYVSSRPDVLTDFRMASRYGTTGLLAHNYLAGKYFSRLEEGQLVYLIYGDGRLEAYVITQSMRFQALTPTSVTSNFVDLDNGESYSASRLFSKLYNQPGQLVLQTCIYADGENSWGRLFIIAEPYPLAID
jgi:hypothetical protein